jgi:tRNA(Ile)-lysidine synthase
LKNQKTLCLPADMTDQTTIKNDFISAIAKTIADFNMIDSEDAVLVAVSGGPDSVGLVLSLLALKKKYTMKIGIAHLNHLLRGEESIRDQSFVKELADKLDLPIFCEQKDVKAYAKKHGQSIEEAGREVRYQFFDQIAKNHGYKKIATGHNKNDNVELVLMNLLRGSGPKGLSGIPPIREKKYIRPLIRMSKPRILDFLKNEKQSYMVDSSNTDMAYLRNKIRHSLIPHLQLEYNPEIIDALDRLSNILKQEEDFWDTQTKQAFHNCLIKSETDCLEFERSSMSNLHPALLNRVLRTAIFSIKKDLKRISLAHINDMVQFCFNSTSGTSLDLPDQIRVYKNKTAIMIKKEKQPLRQIGQKEKELKLHAHTKQGNKS